MEIVINNLGLILLVVTFILIFLNAASNYAALPIFITKHANPDSNAPRVLLMGRTMIAIMLGLEGLAAMACHSYQWGLIWALLITLIIYDTGCSLETLYKNKNIPLSPNNI